MTTDETCNECIITFPDGSTQRTIVVSPNVDREQEWLDELDAEAAMTPAGTYVKLHTADPGAAGATDGRGLA